MEDFLSDESIAVVNSLLCSNSDEELSFPIDRGVAAELELRFSTDGSPGELRAIGFDGLSTFRSIAIDRDVMIFIGSAQGPLRGAVRVADDAAIGLVSRTGTATIEFSQAQIDVAPRGLFRVVVNVGRIDLTDSRIVCEGKLLFPTFALQSVQIRANNSTISTHEIEIGQMVVDVTNVDVPQADPLFATVSASGRVSVASNGVFSFDEAVFALSGNLELEELGTLVVKDSVMFLSGSLNGGLTSTMSITDNSIVFVTEDARAEINGLLTARFRDNSVLKLLDRSKLTLSDASLHFRENSLLSSSCTEPLPSLVLSNFDSQILFDADTRRQTPVDIFGGNDGEVVDNGALLVPCAADSPSPFATPPEFPPSVESDMSMSDSMSVSSSAVPASLSPAGTSVAGGVSPELVIILSVVAVLLVAIGVVVGIGCWCAAQQERTSTRSDISMQNVADEQYGIGNIDTIENDSNENYGIGRLDTMTD